TGDFSQALGVAVRDGTALNACLQSAALSVSNLLAVTVTPGANYFADDPAAAEQAILNRLAVSFLASPLTANYQRTFKKFLADDNALLDQLLDVLVAQVTRVIR